MNTTNPTLRKVASKACTPRSREPGRGVANLDRVSRNAARALALVFGLTLHEIGGVAQPLELRGATVVPHVQSHEMRYRREPDFSLGARVQVFLQNAADKLLSLRATCEMRLRGRTPEELLQADEWAWHDLPSA